MDVAEAFADVAAATGAGLPACARRAPGAAGIARVRRRARVSWRGSSAARCARECPRGCCWRRSPRRGASTWRRPGRAALLFWATSRRWPRSPPAGGASGGGRGRARGPSCRCCRCSRRLPTTSRPCWPRTAAAPRSSTSTTGARIQLHRAGDRVQVWTAASVGRHAQPAGRRRGIARARSVRRAVHPSTARWVALDAAGRPAAVPGADAPVSARVHGVEALVSRDAAGAALLRLPHGRRPARWSTRPTSGVWEALSAVDAAAANPRRAARRDRGARGAGVSRQPRLAAGHEGVMAKDLASHLRARRSGQALVSS